MRSARLLLMLMILCLVAACGSPQQTIQYPETRKADVVDDYHGTEVADPYRWLEDLNSDETAAWVAAQNEITFSFLERVPARERIVERMTELWNYPRYSTPFERTGHYFFLKNDGLQNQAVLYVQEGLEGEPRVLIDPNTFSEDGTVALSDLKVSSEGRYVMYATSENGSDWETFHVRDIESGEDLPDELNWIKFDPPAWTADSKGFFYARFEKPSEGDEFEEATRNQRLYYHRLRTAQDEDELIYERPDDPELGFSPETSHDGRYLIITISWGSDRRNNVYYIDLSRKPYSVVRLLDELDATYEFIGNRGSVFFFKTNLNAPNYRVISIDIRNPDRNHWKELVPESAAVLDAVKLIRDNFIISSLEDVKARLTIHDLDGSLIKNVELPGIGAVNTIQGSPDGDGFFFDFESFTFPRAVYRYDFSSDGYDVFFPSQVDFDASGYMTQQVFYESKDGTVVPMFITHRKDLVMNGSNPTYVYAYGGFTISMTPYFRVYHQVWMEMGGVLAVPNLRGGGEYGKKWHDAGKLENKQNGIDDFIAAVEYLIDEGYTSTPKVAIGGGSNGGLMTCACVTQRPDLFGAVISDVGVLDMLRYHKFTIGWAWASDYGTSDDPEQFEYLYKYSPLHNVKPGTEYPAVMILTSDHDDRVVPSHSFKFTSAMQEAQAGAASILIRVEKKAGHGAGMPTGMQIVERADKWAFLAAVLDMDVDL